MTVVFQKPQDLLAAVPLKLGRGEWFTVDQASLSLFLKATGDHPWLEPDDIVPGYLVLALVNLFLPQLIDVQGATMGVNVGCGRVRFPAPVTVGSRIRGHGELTEATMEKGGVQTVVRVTVEIDNGTEPACVVDTISRYFVPTT